MSPRKVLLATLGLIVLLVSTSLAIPGLARAPVAEVPENLSIRGLQAAPYSSAPFFPNVRVTDNSSPYLWQVEPTMVINASGTIFVGWKETTGPDTAGLRVGASYSKDQGKTWAPNILMNQSHPGQSCANSDPWMALAPDDRVHYSYLEFNCVGTNSGLDVSNTTNGTWGSAHFVVGHGGLVDKDSLAIDSTGRLYAVWDENNVLQITWSDNGGNSWVVPFNPGNVGDAVLGAIVTTLGSNTVYLTWWDINTNNIMFESSTNRGASWSGQTRVNDVMGSAQQVGSWQIPIPTMNVDPNSGTIYVAWPDMRNGNQDIFIANSTNGGATWGTNHRINDDSGTASQWMVDTAVDSTGKVHAAWEDGRTGNWNIFYANSTDGGATWTSNLKVTTAETPLSYDRPGDYFALQSGPNNVMYIVWTDGRGANFDIYYARNPGLPAATVTVATQPTGQTVVVDGVSGKAPITNTWLVGSNHTVSVSQTIPIAAGSRYNFSSWSDGGARAHIITASQDGTITATFRRQFTATAAVSPASLTFSVDNVSKTGSFSAWWNESTTHWISSTSPQYASADVRYSWTNWSDGGALAHALAATAPLAVMATFHQEQGLFVGTQPGNLNFTFDGTTYASSQTFWLTANTYHSVAVSTLIAAGGGTRYRFASWSDSGAASHVVYFTAATTIQASFSAEYYLTVSSPVPGASPGGWYASGSTATATIAYSTYLVSAGQRLVFQGWGGDSTGTGSTTNAIVMNGPKTAQALYQTQYYLDVRSTYSSATGSGWYANGTSIRAAVTSGNVSLGTGIRTIFTGWAGDASGTDPTGSNAITMDRPRIATAQWQKQYLVTVTSDVGTVQGGGWYAAGTSVTLQAPAQASQGGQTYTFAAWTGDITGTSSNLTFTINQPINARATWTTPVAVTSNALVLGLAAGVIIVIVVAVLVVLMRRRKKEPEEPREP